MKITKEILSSAIGVSYNFEDVFVIGESCFVFVFDDTDTQLDISIHTEPKSKTRSGIHLIGDFESLEDLEFRLEEALDNCFRNDYTDIYLHGKLKA